MMKRVTVLLVRATMVVLMLATTVTVADSSLVLEL